jgi:NitT/TauT family transport system substrate-binding protein
MLRSTLARTALAAIALACSAIPHLAHAQDRLKLSAGARGAFEDQISEVGEQEGFFRTHGLTLDLRRPEGGRDALQAAVAGDIDVATSVDTLATIGAYGAGAPIRVIGNAAIGAHEFWYVAASSPIRSLKQAVGKKVAYSAAGTASNLMVLGLQELHGVKLQPIATGDPAATLVKLMSGQIDIGYSLPPFAVTELEQNKIRVIARGDDLPMLARQTVRFIVANANVLAQRPDLIRRYLLGYRDTVDWLFSSDPRAIAAYGRWAGVAENVARRARDEFILRQNLAPDEISGLETILADAAAYRIIQTPLTAEQVKTLIQLQPR